MIAQIDRISPEYVAEQQRLHADPRGYGGRGRKWAPFVGELVTRFSCSSVLDYGAGRGSLAVALHAVRPSTLRIAEYDPAIPGKDAPPLFADLVVVTDVLEHVEPEKIGAVLKHLRVLTRKVLFVVVSLVETAKTLSDGRQAHILLQSADWWRTQLQAAGFSSVEEPRVKPDKQWVAVLS